MRATLWVLLLVLAVGVSVLADDGSVAWPVEDIGGYSPLRMRLCPPPMVHCDPCRG